MPGPGPGPGPTPCAFTTGPILNSGTMPSTALQLLISNDNSSGTVGIAVEVFEVTLSPTGVAKTPVAQQLFSLNGLQSVAKTFNVTGFPAFELQLSVTGGPAANVVANVFATDAAGNLNAAQRVLQSELSPIAALTPIP